MREVVTLGVIGLFVWGAIGFVVERRIDEEQVPSWRMAWLAGLGIALISALILPRPDLSGL